MDKKTLGSLLILGIVCTIQTIVLAQIVSRTRYAAAAGHVFEITGEFQIRDIELYVGDTGVYKLRANFYKAKNTDPWVQTGWKLFGSFGDMELEEQTIFGNCMMGWAATYEWDLGTSSLPPGIYVVQLYVQRWDE